MSEKITGNFNFALMQMIARLKRAEGSPPLAKFAQDILREWDDNRGSDWYTSTKLIEEGEDRE